MLNRRGHPPEPALTSEVGVFGFFYRGEVIDTVGLCTPEALAFYPPPASDVWDERGRPLTYEDNLTPTRMVLDLILRIRDRGLPVILISHNMPHVFEVSDRIHIQRLGRRAALVPTKNITMPDAVAIMTGAKSADVVAP